MDIESARAQAKSYADLRGLYLQPTLMGFGQDGYIWATDENTVIKVFERRANYDRELGCYQRLLEREVSRIGPLEIPRLIGFDETLLVIEMSVVSPPYLLDFGKAWLDTRPDYDQEALNDWEVELKELFGERTEDIKSALRGLEALGICYYDAKPGNIRF